MTAGEMSSQPSRRSARAPSDSCRLRPGGASAGAPTVTVWVLELIGPFLPSLPAGRLLRGGSRDQALRLQGVVHLSDHRLLRARRADAARRRDQVRDADVGADDLVRLVAQAQRGLEGERLVL